MPYTLKKQKKKNKSRKALCNPIARKNKITKGSCFVPSSVRLMKKHYNKNNPADPITSMNDKDILREIQLKANNDCKEDICLIKKFVKNKRDSSMLKALLFPPKQPNEWTKDPDTWLTNFDIMNVLNQYEDTYKNFVFIGPSPIDYNAIVNKSRCVCKKLCNFQMKNYLAKTPPKTKFGIVFNLDPHTKGGSHWVAMFIDLVDNFVFFFNSTGEKIPSRIEEFANEVISQGRENNIDLSFHQNKNVEHQKSNTECGMYCLYFIITMLIRKREINYDVENGLMSGGDELTKAELFNLFQGKHGKISDQHVFDKREEYFSL